MTQVSERAAAFLEVIRWWPITPGQLPKFIPDNEAELSLIPQHEKRIVWNAMKGVTHG